MAPPNSKEPTLYEILSLTPKHLEGQASAAQSKVVKKAYHRALLTHHPDKNNTATNNNNNNNEAGSEPSKAKNNGKSSSSPPKVTYTVDQIQEAYTTLSDTKKRAEYNRSLTVNSASSRNHHQQFTHTATFSTSRSFQTGLEVVDLDDVDFDERKGLYFRACRCGNPRAYRFKESNLEENEDEGVLMVECLDCSLWLKVLFTAAVVDDNNETTNSSGNQGNQARAAPPMSSQQQQQPAQRSQSNQAARRDSSQSVGEKKGGWSFKVSLGLSLGGSASASASSGRK